MVRMRCLGVYEFVAGPTSDGAPDMAVRPLVGKDVGGVAGFIGAHGLEYLQ